MWSCSKWSLVSFLALGVALIQIPHEVLAQKCPLKCKGTCSAEGECICNMPSPDSIMGERMFKTGEFCDTQAVMCDGTNSFWCQSGGSCNELVQGENYKCKCLRGFAGEHCEVVGLLCGDIYCFNNGTCAPNSNCNCPEGFHGARDCSLPTPRQVEAPASEPHAPNHSGRDGKVWLPVGIVIGLLLAVSCVCGLGLRCYRRRVRKLSQSRFHELQHVQMNDEADFYDDGEDENVKALR